MELINREIIKLHKKIDKDNSKKINVSIFEFGSDKKEYEKKLINCDEGFCYLIGVVGQFDSKSDEVLLSERDGYWELTKKRNDTNAKVVCIKYIDIK